MVLYNKPHKYDVRVSCNLSHTAEMSRFNWLSIIYRDLSEEVGQLVIKISSGVITLKF